MYNFEYYKITHLKKCNDSQQKENKDGGERHVFNDCYLLEFRIRKEKKV